MRRYYYSDSISNFRNTNDDEILGVLARNNDFSLTQDQRNAWHIQINILREVLSHREGFIYFEYSIPRMGQRIDVVMLIGPVIFVVEFKVGAREYTGYAIDQVCDYALDLKNFHETSHERYIAPILISTQADTIPYTVSLTPQNDKLFSPVKANPENFALIIDHVCSFTEGQNIDKTTWEQGRYSPTPTIVEAAMSLYKGHSVDEISRSDASAINLKETSETISEIILSSQKQSKKSICFVTGVPGAGKTLVGLNIATKYIDKDNDLYSVFLSGNGPLVKILCEALARDKVEQAKRQGETLRKGEAKSEAKMFIQNVHHFRDDCLINLNEPPLEHVALFDEAQRAWDIKKTSDFMKRRKNKPGFGISEPEFLISCMDRHQDWAVIVCLVGGGQEINTGEAGILSG